MVRSYYCGEGGHVSANLVQIAVNAHKFGTKEASTRLTALACAVRPREVTELVDALSRMFGRIGMHKVCAACFRRESYAPMEAYFSSPAYHYSSPKGGCCGFCGLLGHSRCINKPMVCAGWMCHSTSMAWPRTALFLQRIMPRMGMRAYGVELERDHLWSAVELHRLRILRHAVDAWDEQAVWEVRTASTGAQLGAGWQGFACRAGDGAGTNLHRLLAG